MLAIDSMSIDVTCKKNSWQMVTCFPSVCRQNGLFYKVVLLATLMGTLLNTDYSDFLLSLFSLVEVQEEMV